jgi:hypothetical protein
LRNLMLFIMACAGAALVPLLSGVAGGTRVDEDARGHEAPGAAVSWPTHWEGRPLRPLALTPQERTFAGAFPGAMARFTDGSMEILFRRVDRPTRNLHPSSDCLRAWGYSVKPLPAQTAAPGHTWSCFLAKRNGESLQVREMVMTGNGEQSAQESWTDVSSWYWNAFLGRTKGPWTAVTLSRRIPPPPK